MYPISNRPRSMSRFCHSSKCTANSTLTWCGLTMWISAESPTTKYLANLFHIGSYWSKCSSASRGSCRHQENRRKKSGSKRICRASQLWHNKEEVLDAILKAANSRWTEHEDVRRRFCPLTEPEGRTVAAVEDGPQASGRKGPESGTGSPGSVELPSSP